MSSKETYDPCAWGNFPHRVTLTEVGLRDGFQAERKIVPTDMKLELIAGLVESGVKRIQAASFVNPGRVPQMADADDLFQRLPPREDVVFTALTLNQQGAERACRCGLADIEASISASDHHSRRNTGFSMRRAVQEAEAMIRTIRKHGRRIHFSLQCAFGCLVEGDAPKKRVIGILTDLFGKRPPPDIASITLADTTGMADPLSVKTALAEIKSRFEAPSVGLHFHDTRGLGLVNVTAALSCGADMFDTSLGGMGGCPFIEGAAGNIATGDTAYLMHTLGIETGVDIRSINQLTLKLESFFEKKFSGKIHRVLSDSKQCSQSGLF